MTSLVIAQRIFELIVPDGRDSQSISSEIDPLKIGSYESHHESWDNGPTIYNRWLNHTFYLIVWNNQPRIIETLTYEGSYSGDLARSDMWREVTQLPEQLQITTA